MLVSAFGWYGALIGCGMAICIVLAFFMMKKRGYDSDIVFDIALICIPVGIFGARTYFVLNDIAHNNASWTLGEFFGFFDGRFVGFAGLAIYGGLIGGVLGLIIVRLINKRKPIEKQVNFIQLMDVCLCLVILGQAIGRWGNYANGEAYGQLIENPAWQWFPFAVFIQGGKFGTGWYHACFFYESMWNIVGFVLLQIIYNGKRKSFDGFCIAFYCIWYGFIRFFVEGLRSDSMYFGSIKANQLISALIFFAGVSIVVYHIVMAKRVGKKPFIFVKEDELNMDYYGYEKSFIYLKTTFKKDQSSKDTQQVADTVENKNDDLGDEK